MAFSTEEKQRIIAQSKVPISKRPSYFSRLAQREEQITEGFEQFLILQNQTQKQKSLDWINQALDIEVDNTDRDALLQTYMDLRTTDASERVTELDEKLQNFNTFMTSLLGDQSKQGNDPSRFSQVSELNLFVQSLQRPLSKMTIQRDQAFHEGNLVTWLKARLDQEKTDENSRKELESWQTVISDYEGSPG